jgi:hypothetical protein
MGISQTILKQTNAYSPQAEKQEIENLVDFICLNSIWTERIDSLLLTVF